MDTSSHQCAVSTLMECPCIFFDLIACEMTGPKVILGAIFTTCGRARQPSWTRTSSHDDDPEVRAILGEDSLGLGPSPSPPNPEASGVVDRNPQEKQPGELQQGQHGGGEGPPAANMEAEEVPAPEGDDTPSVRADNDEIEPLEEPNHPMTPAPELTELPANQTEQALHPTAAEGPSSSTSRPTFADLHRRHERLERLPVRNAKMFGPTSTATHENHSEPYQPPASTDEANLYQDIDVDMVKGDLPMGWRRRVENGF